MLGICKNAYKMAQIRTIDGERHNVKQTKEELDRIFYTSECIETGVVCLDWQVTITSWESGEEKDRIQYEPVTFIRSNIMMYY